MYDDVCTLITKTITTNAAGDPVETISTAGQTEVWCEVMSASWKDKQAAEARGETADLTVKLADRADYSGQIFVSYASEEYKVVDKYYDDRSKELRLVVTKWQRQ